MTPQQTTLDGENIEELRTRYKLLVEHDLPKQAESHWPIHLDHCFGRVLLDNVFGCNWHDEFETTHMTAYRNLSADQLRHAIALGQRMIDGGAPVVDALNYNSLRWRGAL